MIAKVKIVRNSELGEWIVRCYDVDGNRLPECDYYTDDKQDAKETAKYIMDCNN